MTVNKFQVVVNIISESSRHERHAVFTSHRLKLVNERQQPYLGTVKQLEVNNINTSLTCCWSTKKRSLAPGDTRNSSLNHKSKQVTMNQ